MKTLSRLLLFAALASGLVAAGAATAEASHFRYGYMQWRTPNPAQPRTVEITFRSGWRRTAFGAPSIGSVVGVGSLTFGDGGSAALNITVDAMDSTEDWIVGTAKLIHTYGADGTYAAEFTSCCRISTLKDGNNDLSEIIRSAIVINSISPNNSPVSGALPIITVPQGVPAAVFTIPGSDPDGDPILFSIAPTSQTGLVKAAPTGLSIDGNTGVVTWNTTGAIAGGLYAIQFKIADSRGASVPVDVILKPVAVTSQPPQLLINNSAAAANFTVTVGQPLAFTVKGVDPDGAVPVTITSSGLPSGSSISPSLPVTLTSPASATFTWTPGPGQVGGTTISFAVTDNTGLQDTNSATITVALATQATSTTASASPDPSSFNQPVTLTALVASSPAPVGTVQFTVDGLLVGSAQLSALDANTSQATLVVNGYSPGVHTFSASYLGATSGGTAFSASTSAPSTFTVANSATTTALTSSSNPSVFGGSVTFTVAVQPASGSGVPSGSVTLSDGPTVLAVLPLAGGVATFSTSALAVGVHNLTAAYGGDSAFSASSGSLAQTVNQAPTATGAVASPDPSVFGQTVNFAASVTSNGSPVTTGTVTFKMGATVVAGPLVLNGSGQAAFSTAGWPVSTTTLSVEYSGTTNYRPSAGSVTFTVNQASSQTTLSSSVNPSDLGQAVTFTAVVSPVAPGSGAVTGTVQFLVDGVNLGGPVGLVGGVATITTSALAPGSRTITALYTGDPHFAGSGLSIPQTVRLVVPPFSVPLANPDGACICTPLLMNTDTAGTQHWFVKALGAGPLTITAIAHAVNSTDPENVVANVYDLANHLLFTVSPSYPAGTPNGTEVAQSNSVAAPAAGTIYRVSVSTPGTPSTQPHYRLKFEGAEAAATNSASSPSFEDPNGDVWYFNLASGEPFDVRVFVTGTPSTEAILRYTLTDPAGVVTSGSVIANTADGHVTAPASAIAGTWAVKLQDASDHSSNPANGHYGLSKDAGGDHGIYLGWQSAGTGRVRVSIVTGASGGAPFLLPVTLTLAGDDGAQTLNVNTGVADFQKRHVGGYSLTVGGVPTGWTLMTPAAVNVTVTCDGTIDLEVVIADITPPVIAVADQALEATSPAGAVATYAPTATDVVSGSVPVSCSPASGSTFALGTTTVECEASDAAGNKATARFTVTVTAPTTTAIGAPTVVYGADGVITVTVTSAAGPAPGDISLTVDGIGHALALVGGAATFNAGMLPAGDHALTAAYGGSGDFLASGSAGTLHVDKAPSTTLVSCPASVTYDGAPQAVCTATVNGAGGLSQPLTVTYTDNLTAGTATASAEYAGDANHAGSSDTTHFTINKAAATISVAGYTGIYDGASHGATGSATGVTGENLTGLLGLGASFATVPGGTAHWSFAGNGNYLAAEGDVAIAIAPKPASVTPAPATKVYGDADPVFTGSLSGFLPADGVSAVYSRPAGETVPGSPYPISAALGPSNVLGNYAITYNTAPFTITKRATTTTLTTSLATSAAGQAVTFTATVPGVSVGGTTGTVTFLDGSTVIGTGALNGAAVATFTTSSLTVGPHTITAVYGGDDNYTGSTSAPVSQLVYAFANANGGTFVIGDLNASVGAGVTFWGAQWEKLNALSGGRSNASFKGFANAVSPAPVVAGGTWTTNPGNSSNPPPAVAAYIAVIVTGKVNKSGADISGGVTRLVVVKTAPGYDANPGHAGTGTIVAVVP